LPLREQRPANAMKGRYVEIQSRPNALQRQ
jgi:hypothetical protein